MVETGTSSYYTALGDATTEPVLKQICKLIAADEYRHFKLFYDHMRRYLGREKLGLLSRLKIAGGRITESEDDELAFAYHCGNEAEGVAYDHKRCIAGYMGQAMGVYQWKHIERSTGMVLKTVGLPPRGRLGGGAAKPGLDAVAAQASLVRGRDAGGLGLCERPTLSPCLDRKS